MRLVALLDLALLVSRRFRRETTPLPPKTVAARRVTRKAACRVTSSNRRACRRGRALNVTEMSMRSRGRLTPSLSPLPLTLPLTLALAPAPAPAPALAHDASVVARGEG